MKTLQQKIEWIINQHRSVNHTYGREPYEFHLQMTVDVFEKFAWELKDFNLYDDVLLATWGHDLIEDTRNTYNDVKSELGEVSTEIIYALTNEKGRSRKERANKKYYEGIRNTNEATFVKLCDRIANVKHSINTNSTMLEVYRKENDAFVKAIRADEYPETLSYLISLLS